MANLRATKITEDNYKAILSDIVAIFRYYQKVQLTALRLEFQLKCLRDKLVTKKVRELVHEIVEIKWRCMPSQ